MKMEGNHKARTQNKTSYNLLKFIICLSILFLILILFSVESSPFDSPSTPSSPSWDFFQHWAKSAGATSHSDLSNFIKTTAAKLRDSVTFLPLKDLRFSKTAMTGNTWFMSTLNDTCEENETEYLYFPSQASKGRILCIKGRDSGDGTNNSYALAWEESLPNTATLLKGLTYISDTYYNYQNLWHGLCAMTPFVRWSMKNECIKPTRWVLFHWGELKVKMGSWIQQLMLANYGEIKIEDFDKGDGPYCFEKAVVMRHDLGSMGADNKLKVFDLMRCKARAFCSLNPGREKDVNETGIPIIRLTLLMRRGSRSFKNATVVTDIFAKECARVEGCILRVAQSEDLSFCDQVKVMTYTDILASPHGAQLTNMLFMDRGSSVMEFFPKGWLENAGIGQYAHHWMANQSGMKHQGAWWDPNGEECPLPKKDDLQCFLYHKDGKVGVNETYFAEWTRKVLDQVRISKKLEQASKSSLTKPQMNKNVCSC